MDHLDLVADDDNPVHGISAPDAFWSSSNIGEAMPGVMTPLSWSIWSVPAECSMREPFVSMGVLPRRERGVPHDPTERAVNIFFGRVAGRVDFLTRMGDSLPGTTGARLAERIYGIVPPGYRPQRRRRRYPLIAVRSTTAFLTLPRTLLENQRKIDQWWRSRIGSVATMSHAEAIIQLADARERFLRSVILDGEAVACVVQPAFEALTALVQHAGVGDLTALTSGYGEHAETAMVQDLWKASRGGLSVEELLARHGYHGPSEGELSGRVWREDPAPLRSALAGWSAMADDADPVTAEQRKRQERLALEARLLASLPVWQRPLGRLVFRMGERGIPMRGVAKAAFLQSLDMARACARRIGVLLAERGVLADPEDVFFLTVDEITAPQQHDWTAVVARRRERHDQYRAMALPETWQGMPTAREDSSTEHITELQGVGASAGVVEGRVKVILDPADPGADVEPGEILVTRMTDPSWASLMFLSSALVVDIGGTFNHAAIIARELGIPCIVNTKDGSRALRTGDYCRIDGSTGTVQILERAQPSAEG
ncbi:PEP-utilizing enzyme [Mycobacterium intracellulare]|uniref:PEP-utilizing enzyme n=1 Tax=Mycobacterium intracellulare TaxID=1767 RepID=UPI001EEEA50B|nr:PEP-utilizing enzyme [Mycobacterium intracellulare]MEE3753155.1 PEP-utilizing enzyme [Mycobacterium intracellulare]